MWKIDSICIILLYYILALLAKWYSNVKVYIGGGFLLELLLLMLLKLVGIFIKIDSVIRNTF